MSIEPRSGRTRRLAAFAIVLAAQFALFEAGMRLWGSSEAAPSFQGLFMDDPAMGYRLKPGARTRFRTVEFEADIAINGSGVRDDEEIGSKPAGERRIVILGDSLVLSVQVDFHRTFGELLELRLNRDAPAGVRYRVINAGVQGFGPVEEALFFRHVARRFEPDVVLTAVFVGNDAEEAVLNEARLSGDARPLAESVQEGFIRRLRRLVRRSMVLQVFRLRAVAAAERFTPSSVAPPEPPLQSYAASPAPRIQRGIEITRRALEMIAADAASVGARAGIVFMPARFQVDDADYQRLRANVTQAGGILLRDGANARFDAALADLPAPRVDVLPALRRALPGPDLFYQQTVHLTPRGHEVVAAELDAFLRRSGLLDRERTEPGR